MLDDVDLFDAGFFGYSPKEAALTDPQHRVFLECCWHALENAGYGAARWRGEVGVFAGTNISTYLHRMAAGGALDDQVSDYQVVIGNDKDSLTTAVSYKLDLNGPSMAVQTFCSTSLVAVHLAAARACGNGECDMALAGGVSIRVPDRIGHRYTEGGMESPDGHVRTFDARAHGSMFGDGAGVVVLKRLADALADGDTVQAVIRGSAVNNDGSLKVGFTAPSVNGQADRDLPRAGRRGRRPGDRLLPGGARHRHRARRPDRAGGADEGVRRRPGTRLVRDRLGEDQRRPPRPGGRGVRADQGGAVVASTGSSRRACTTPRRTRRSTSPPARSG